MPTKIDNISGIESNGYKHKEFFGDYIYDNNMFLFFDVLAKNEEDNTHPFYIRKSSTITSMPMIYLKNYLQNPPLYPDIDRDCLIQSINGNIMKVNPDKTFGSLCNNYSDGVTKKNITNKRKNVNYKQFWIVYIHDNAKNRELFSELVVFFKSIFDTFEEKDISELTKCMKHSNDFLLYNVFAESKKKVQGCIIYNIEEYGSFISYIGVDSFFCNHGISSFLLMLVQSHLKYNRKKYNLYLISNEKSEAFDFYKKRNFAKLSNDDKVNLPCTLYDNDTTMIKLYLSSLITKKIYYTYPVVFNVYILKEKVKECNLLKIKKNIRFNTKEKAVLIFPFFCHGRNLETILSKDDSFFSTL